MANFCPSCGTPVQSDVKFCGQCGFKLGVGGKEKSGGEEQPTVVGGFKSGFGGCLGVFVAIVVIIIIAGVCVALAGNN